MFLYAEKVTWKIGFSLQQYVSRSSHLTLQRTCFQLGSREAWKGVGPGHYGCMWNFPGGTYFVIPEYGDLRQGVGKKSESFLECLTGGFQRFWEALFMKSEGASSCLLPKCWIVEETFLPPSCLGVVRSSLEGDLRRLLTEACGDWEWLSLHYRRDQMS